MIVMLEYYLVIVCTARFVRRDAHVSPKEKKGHVLLVVTKILIVFFLKDTKWTFFVLRYGKKFEPWSDSSSISIL